MKIIIKTPVAAPMTSVWKGFDETLFTKLSPPFPPVKLLRFDGSLTGDVVSLELNFIVFKQEWTSLIIDQKETEQEIYFVDEGKKLPFFLSFWRHKHRLIKNGEGTLIADEIEYRTPSILFDYLMYPIFWAQFAYRGPIYKRLFA
jgi:ligand-binding SRPBCC domain-containing protein